MQAAIVQLVGRAKRQHEKLLNAVCGQVSLTVCLERYVAKHLKREAFGPELKNRKEAPMTALQVHAQGPGLTSSPYRR